MTNPAPSRTPTPQQWRPLVACFFIHVILGYSLYVIALVQSTPPEWALNGIEQLKPTFGAIETAARLSERPFPIQVMILYAILSSFVLGIYCFSYAFLVKRVRQEMHRRLCEQWGQTGLPFKNRLTFFGVGLVQLYLCGYHVPVRSFVEGGYWINGRLIGRLDPALFSSSILSATCLLFTALLIGLEFMLIPMSFYLAASRFQSPTSGRR